MSDALKPGDQVSVAFVGEYVEYDHDKGYHRIKGHFLDGTALGHHPWTIAVHWSADLHHQIQPTGHAMSDEKWVTLTPEQVEALEQGVIVRAHRGDTMVQGLLEGLVGEFGPDVWVSDIRVKSPERIEVRERDVPKSDLDPVFRWGDKVRLVDLDGREFHWTIRPAVLDDPQRLVSVRVNDLTDPSVLRLAAGDIETMRLGWGGLPRSLPGTLRTLADAIDEHRAALRGETS